MSEGIRRCTYCKHQQLFITAAPCGDCYNVEGHPNWEPGLAGKLAIRVNELEAALAAAPVREEREGECFCGMSRIVEVEGVTYWRVKDECEMPFDFDDWKIDANAHCWNCGAHLGADGVARRWREEK